MFWLWKPKISVVVLVDRLQREMPRTLYSLSASYQQGVKSRDYEVIVVGNTTLETPRPDLVRDFGPNFHYAPHPGDVNSPTAALNFGISLARGRHVTMMTDGACILSPGVLRRNIAATRLAERPVVFTPAWQLSPDLQSQAVHKGTCPSADDRPLESVDWRDNGYRLFEISSPAGVCRDGWSGPILASQCITIQRQHYSELSGCLPSRQITGDSSARVDFLRRAIADPAGRAILILGEGTFRRYPSEVATNRGSGEQPSEQGAEHPRIGGEAFSAFTPQPILFGHMPAAARRFFEPALIAASKAERERVCPVPAHLPVAASESTPSPNAPQRKVA